MAAAGAGVLAGALKSAFAGSMGVGPAQRLSGRHTLTPENGRHWPECDMGRQMKHHLGPIANCQTVHALVRLGWWDWLDYLTLYRLSFAEHEVPSHCADPSDPSFWEAAGMHIEWKPSCKDYKGLRRRI